MDHRFSSIYLSGLHLNGRVQEMGIKTSAYSSALSEVLSLIF